MSAGCLPSKLFRYKELNHSLKIEQDVWKMSRIILILAGQMEMDFTFVLFKETANFLRVLLLTNLILSISELKVLG